MKYCILFCLLICFSNIKSNAQKIDSLYFHLYTDSLKKGVYNYINVDGLLSNGHYLPLDTTQIVLSSSDGKWIGNNLLLEPSFNKEFVVVTAKLKQNASLQKTVTIYMKKKPDDEHLKTVEEIMNEGGANDKKRKQN